MALLKDIEPVKVFEFFEKISSIPRGSGHTDKIADYCVDFAAARGLKCFKDETGSVIIYKNGSHGRENAEPLILQGHLDMVWEKEADSDFDFENQGINLLLDGDYLTADKTTLGGDDGIAVAMCLAILDSESISHPPLEVVFTTDEETGMDGARALDVSLLRGKRMINIDSEEEGILWASCAGGARADITLDAATEENTLPAYEIHIGGLRGGHSGTEINRGGANASVLAGGLLKKLEDTYDFFIAAVNGGTMDNAITRENRFTVCTDADIKETVEKYEEEIKNRYRENDGDIFIRIDSAVSKTRYSSETSRKITGLLSSFPYGVIKMSSVIDGLVQTSLNLGITSSDDEKIRFGFSVRSNVNSEKEELLNQLESIARKYSADFTVYGNYSAWEYRENSPLRDSLTAIYEKMYSKPLEIAAIHAGLECGIFAEKIEGLDCVSLGPDLFNVHTPSERLGISSTRRTYEFLLKVLEVI